MAGTVSPAPAGAVPTARVQASGTTVATTGFRPVDIPGDGVVLKANVIAPAPAGRYPALVFPSSWGMNDAEYLAQASALAAHGYVVVSYTPRGWWLSGGEIDTAGPKDMADLSKVIDWTIANTAADPTRIGAAGVSYGAGISLLGSAFDRRIRVVAMLSGWTDLVYSLYGDSTRHKQSVGLLTVAAAGAGHIGPDLAGVMADFAANRNVDQIIAWAKVRSAKTYIDKINANRPAVLIANAWGDTIFAPNQLADFYGRLTTPKRLELRPGDHATAELTGLMGLDNAAWTSLRRWFDQYLAGVDTGVTREAPVQIQPLNAPAEARSSWSALNSSTRRYGLGRIRLLDGTGSLGGKPTAGWSKTIPTDLDTTADGGVMLLTNGAAGFTGQQPQILLPTVNRAWAGVWMSAPSATPLRVRGIPTLHLELTGTTAQGTVVAYLYDLDPLGNAKLVTHAPVSWLGGKPGSRTVDLGLSATAYDMPAGHSLALVVDSVDPLYFDENAPLGSITIAGGSYLDVPLK
ncbi:acyl esterase [Planosporangium flavigriseum]|nr:acyl esterase [Planosporangium flavigriseum]